MPFSFEPSPDATELRIGRDTVSVSDIEFVGVGLSPAIWVPPVVAYVASKLVSSSVLLQLESNSVLIYSLVGIYTLLFVFFGGLVRIRTKTSSYSILTAAWIKDWLKFFESLPNPPAISEVLDIPEPISRGTIQTEQLIVIRRPSYLPLMPFFIIAVGAAFVVAVFKLALGFGDETSIMLLAAPWLILLFKALRWYFTYYAITSRRLILVTGLLNRSTSERLLNSLEGYEVRRSLIQRLFDLGTLSITSQGHPTLTFTNISNPYKFRDQLISQPHS